jgi:YD repeat-containing protein
MVINGKAQALHGGSNLIACGVMIRRLAVLGIALTAALPAATGGPLWEKPSLFLGSLDIDGGLRQRFELGTLSGSPEFAFPIYMEHGIRSEDGVSEYRIPQLETYVVPEGRDEILWLEPGGIRHIFKTKDIAANAPARQKEAWLAIKADAGNAEFRSDDGWIYRYEAGSIASLTAPTGRVLRFETEGLRICRIYQEVGGKEIDLLAAEDNDIGLTGSLAIGLVTHVFGYDAETERLASWKSPQMGRNEVSFAYTDDGPLSGVTLPGGQQLSYTWGGGDGAWQKDSGFKLPEKRDGVFLIADNDFKFQYGITKTGINLMRSDALGIREGFVFNPLTQQLVRKNRDGGETTEFFGVRGASENRLESARDARGRETVRLTYDEKGRVQTRGVPGQAEIRHEYDDLDRITKIFRLKDLQTSYEYDGTSEKPVKITNALGDSIEIAYMPDGQVKRYKNLDVAVYEYEFDALGQHTVEHHPLGYTKTIERDGFGRVTHVKEIDGRETRYHYTADNRLDSVDGADATWSYEYDPDGQLTRLLRDGKTWQKTEREKLAATGETVVRETNSKGEKTVHQFDKEGNLVKQMDALGQATTYRHDKLGQLAGWEDARGVSVGFDRDALGRVAGVDTGENAKLEMAYDLTGRIRRKNNGGQDIQFNYDKAGRLILIDYGKGQTIDYTYDNYGRVLTALTGQGVKTTYIWDALDRKTSERNDIPGGGYTLLDWTYTPSSLKQSVAVWRGDIPVASNPNSSSSPKSKIQNQQSPIVNPSSSSSISNPQSSTSDPSSSSIHDPRSTIAASAAHLLQKTTYAYDALNRYTLISVNDEPRIHYDYDPKTLRLERKRYWNGWIVAYEHFEDGHPKSIVATDDKGKTVTDCHYVWSQNGKLDQRILNGLHHQYKYDPLGRLTEVIKTEEAKH